MKLLISPAKKMRAEDFLPPRTQPPLLEKSAQLLWTMCGGFPCLC